MEEHMLKLMFNVPSDKSIAKITITKETILGTSDPIITTKSIEEIEANESVLENEKQNSKVG